MALSIVRFWANGWIEKLYLEPTYFFSYRYFEWVKPLGNWTYGLFALAFFTSIMAMLGWRYRLAIILFFLSFTYIELMDKTTYLNHYYFTSLLSFVLIWLPAADYFSVDARGRQAVSVPRWTIDCLKVFVGVVYFYAGLAKLNSDWLLQAQPLSIWLPAKYNLPLLGDLLQQTWVHYAFAWSGAAYDLAIPFLLLWKPSRKLAFVLVIIFHVLTRVLFPIGMFPFIMIVSALIFFDAGVQEDIIKRIRNILKSGFSWRSKNSGARTQVRRMGFGSEERVPTAAPAAMGGGEVVDSPENDLWINPSGFEKQSTSSVIRFKDLWINPSDFKIQSTIQKSVITLTLLLHLLLPWRYLLHPGELFWTEEGYRFSWRVMLMEKAGYLTYRVEDPATGHLLVVDPAKYLTTFQQKQLATQPDFILEFAHFLAREFQQPGGTPPAVYAESYVALNGRGSQLYVNPEINLSDITQDTPRTEWLVPFADKIYGL